MATAEKLRAEAATGLQGIHNELEERLDKCSETTARLHDVVVMARATERVTVNDMAQIMGRKRNYVDSLWSVYLKRLREGVAPVKPEDFGLTADVDAVVLLATLQTHSDRQRQALADVKEARTARDEAITMIYASKLMGPSDIARASGVDRNHVLRIVKRAGLDPAYRTNIRNQYTAPAVA